MTRMMVMMTTTIMMMSCFRRKEGTRAYTRLCCVVALSLSLSPSFRQTFIHSFILYEQKLLNEAFERERERPPSHHHATAMNKAYYILNTSSDTIVTVHPYTILHPVAQDIVFAGFFLT
mmetsp:Transcript_3764/g.10791  ORF Transcript_3764/g.10791 Transcript_3764/m.10791 type:complete len:119 (+) Transcript_3764:531-887(+)